MLQASSLSTIALLGLLAGSSLASGLRLYATIAVLGFLGRSGTLTLPGELSVLSNTWIIVTAGLLYLVEFFADKVPYADTGWDALHTFIRVPAGALLAARALGPTNPALEVVAALAGGTVALAAHGTKATARLAINTSPEPFTNWAASVAEDIVAFLGVWAAFQHPYVMLAFVILFLALSDYLVPKILRGLRVIFRKLFGKDRGPAADTPPLSAHS